MASTAEKLRARRIALRKTQSDIASAAGMSTVQYNGYENERHEPSEATMVRLAKALKAKPDELWEDAEDRLDTSPGLLAALKEKIAEDLGIKSSRISISVNIN
jgi:transcriptional regulator with XRE-family HTH domain